MTILAFLVGYGGGVQFVLQYIFRVTVNAKGWPVGVFTGGLWLTGAVVGVLYHCVNKCGGF